MTAGIIGSSPCTFTNGIIAETTFLDHFRQTLRAGLVIGAGHAHFATRRFYRTSDIR
jgi:hypothetical protein